MIAFNKLFLLLVITLFSVSQTLSIPANVTTAIVQGCIKITQNSTIEIRAGIEMVLKNETMNIDDKRESMLHRSFMFHRQFERKCNQIYKNYYKEIKSLGIQDTSMLLMKLEAKELGSKVNATWSDLMGKWQPLNPNLGIMINESLKKRARLSRTPHPEEINELMIVAGRGGRLVGKAVGALLLIPPIVVLLALRILIEIWEFTFELVKLIIMDVPMAISRDMKEIRRLHGN